MTDPITFHFYVHVFLCQSLEHIITLSLSHTHTHTVFHDLTVMNMQGWGSRPLNKLTGRQMMQCAETHTRSTLQLPKNRVLAACKCLCV